MLLGLRIEDLETVDTAAPGCNSTEKWRSAN
jgi:hypothetical protein